MPSTDLFTNPQALFDVAGKVALVTGASGAFGRVAALTLAGAGASVVITGANAVGLASVAAEAASLPGAVPNGVRRVERRPETPEDADAMVAEAVDGFGGLDIVVSASGTNVPAPITEMDPDDFDRVQDANVRQSWLVCRSAGRVLLEQERGGRVILVGSTRGRHGQASGYTAYCSSKAAVHLLTKSLACEWGGAGINVNAIGPTIFRSALTAWMYDDSDERATKVRQGNLARIPLGRLGEPEDFAGAVLFLSSPASAFVTGQVMYVDGGYTAS